MVKIGMITIGQSPRNDILSVMKRYLPSDAQVVECGALDGLDRDEILDLAPDDGDPILVTTLRDGTEVTVTHSKVVPLMKQAVDHLLKDDIQLVVVLCTGGFEELRSDRVFVVDAGSLLHFVIRSFANGVRLGVVRPSPGQVSEWSNGAHNPWGANDVVVTSASPYTGAMKRVCDWERAAQELSEKRVDLVFLTCMGMNEDMKQVFRRITKKPVVLASSVVARMVDELIGDSDQDKPLENVH